MKISKEKLLEELRDTMSNNFKIEVVDYLFQKYSKKAKIQDDDKFVFEDNIMFDDEFLNACNEFLELVCNFIESARN